MSIRKKLASYLLAGLVAFSTLASNLLTLPVYADEAGTDTSGKTYNSIELGLNTKPMIAIYLSNSDELSDGETCNAARAEAIISSGGAISDTYRNDAVYVFPQGMHDNGSVYLAKNLRRSTYSPTYYTARLDDATSSLGKKCISLNNIPSSLPKKTQTFLTTILGDVTIDAAGQSVGTLVADVIGNNYREYRANANYNAEEEWEAISPLIQKYMSASTYKEASSRYAKGKPVTLIFELYLPNNGGTTGKVYYMSAYTFWNANDTTTWKTVGATAANSRCYGFAGFYAFGGNTYDYGGSYHPAYNSSATLDGTKTDLPPSKTGIIGGWCYYSFCNSGSKGSLKITSEKNVTTDDPKNAVDASVETDIAKATGVTVGYTDGISGKYLATQGIKNLDDFAAAVAGCKNVGALTGMVNYGYTEIDSSSKTTQIKSGNNPKLSSTFSLSPDKTGKTYYVAYETSMFCAYESSDITISSGPLGAVAICVDNTNKKADGTIETKITYKTLAAAGSSYFKNSNVKVNYNSSTNTLKLTYNNKLTLDGNADEPSNVIPQPAQSTIVDIDKYYVTNYPAEYGYSTSEKGANTQLVYTNTTLANDDDRNTAHTFAWHWSDDKTAINNDIDAIIGVIVDKNSKLASTITTSGNINNGTKLTFTPDNKYDYNIGLVNKDASWSFTVNNNWVKKYDAGASNFNTSTADAAIAAANAGYTSPINKGTVISSLNVDGETITNLPTGTVTMNKVSGTDLTKDQIKTYLTAYSDYARKYALYESMVAQGSAELAKVIKYWTNAASALYAEACSELAAAKADAQKTIPIQTVTNSYVGEGGYVYIGSKYRHVNFTGVACGTGATTAEAQAAADKALATRIGTGTKEAAEKHRDRIQACSDALYKITGWKLKCVVPYKDVTNPKGITSNTYTLYEEESYQDRWGNWKTKWVVSEYLTLYYIPEYGFSNTASITTHSSKNDQHGTKHYFAPYTGTGWCYTSRDARSAAKDKLYSYYGYPAKYNALTSSYCTDYYSPKYYGYCYYSSYTGSAPAGWGQTGVTTKTFTINGGTTQSVVIYDATSSSDTKISTLPAALKTILKGTNASATRVGGYLAKTIALTKDATKALGELEAKRPHAEIHIYEDLSAAYNNTFKAADVASYMLSMTWKDQTHFVNGKNYLAQVLDRDPRWISNDAYISASQTISTNINSTVSDGKTYLLTLMTEAAKANNSRVINYEVDGKTYYVPVLSAKYNYIAGSYTDITANNKPTKTPNVALTNNKFKVTKENSYLLPKTAVQHTNLDSLGYVYEKFGVYTTTWLIDENNTLQRFVPTTDWANALPSSVKTQVNNVATLLGKYSAVPRANQAAVATAKKANGVDYAKISSANVTAYEVDNAGSEDKRTLFMRYYSGTTIDKSDARYFLTSKDTGTKWYQDKDIHHLLTGTNNIWMTSKTTYKLEASFLNKYITANKAGNVTSPTKFTLVDDNWKIVTEDAAKGYGTYTRASTTEHYGVYPLVKMGYYASPSASDISYTFIVGQKKRNLLSNVHYELGVTSNAAPVVFANALASSANANSLATSYTGNGGSAPVAYSGTGITVSYEGDLAFTFQSFALVDKDADKGYQSEWGNLTSTTSAHTEWLESLGAEESTIQTSTGGTTQAYTLGYIAGSSISMRNKSVYNKDVWTLSANSISYMYEDTEKTVQQDINLTIVGTELQGVAVTKDFYDIDGVKNSKGTYTGKTTEATLTAIKKAAPAVYRALKDMDIGTILEETFDGNAGGAVTADANGNTASGLKATGNNWYNEYVYCLALRMQSTTMMMTPPVFTDKVPIELGPQTPTDKSKYFSNGYGLVVEKLLIKFAGENAGDLGGLTGGEQISATIWSKSKGNTDNDLIIADVPVTAAN